MNHLYDAEVAVLGSLMLDPELMDDLYIQAEELQADERHPKILEYMKHCYEEDGTLDLALMASRSGEKIMRIGGFSYLSELSSSALTTANFKYYQETVRNAY